MSKHPWLRCSWRAEAENVTIPLQTVAFHETIAWGPHLCYNAVRRSVKHVTIRLHTPGFLSMSSGEVGGGSFAI